MSKRTTFTSITPLPAGISREVVLDFLHNHLEMIDLNPLIKERFRIAPPDYAEPEERACIWYQLRDEIAYLPGVAGSVHFTCAFHDLPMGLQTHCYAPMGLNIRDKWSVGGTLPGEPQQPVELGIGAPASGLYLREDIDLRCNILTTPFVRKTLKKAHASLVQHLTSKALVSSSTLNSPVDGMSLRSLGSNEQQQLGAFTAAAPPRLNPPSIQYSAASSPPMYQPAAVYGRNPGASPYRGSGQGFGAGGMPPAARSSHDLDAMSYADQLPRPRSAEMVDGKLISFVSESSRRGREAPSQASMVEMP